MRRVVWGAAMLLLLQGCAYHRVAASVERPADQRYHVVNSHAVGWGADEQTSRTDQCPTNALSEVRVRTSFLDSLATVLSLGIYQPTRIEYRCARNEMDVGNISDRR